MNDGPASAEAHAKMERRALAATGMALPVIGFGVSGPLGTPATSQQEVTRLVEAMLNGGANFFDVGPTYGMAEQRLGVALAARPRASYLVSTKIGTVRHQGRLTKDYSPAGLRSQLEASLKRLCLDHVDIVFLHGTPPEGIQAPAVADMLQELRGSGLTRAIGATLRTREELNACLDDPLIDAIQAPLWQGPAPDWPGLANAAGKAAIVIEAMRPGVSRGAPRSGADLWYALRAARDWARGTRSTAVSKSPLDLLNAALNTDGVACVLTTTTRLAHANANLAVA
ncbi:MAG: aldo/keto reductase, partial [Caulobacterales bacterium]